MRFLSVFLLFLALTLSHAMRNAPPDPVCATGLRSGKACCPLVCNRCGGRRCGERSEEHQTDCCPTSILTGARLCDKRSPPCKLTPIKETTSRRCGSHNRRTFIRTAPSRRGLRKLVRRFKKLMRKRGGVRVIDWEGDAPFTLPEGYYNESGVLFNSKGEYHAVSNAPKTLDDKFSSYLPEVITENFQTYSGERLFAPIMDNKLTVNFVKQGEQAAVNGFGAVFVDVRRRASLKLFDLQGCVIDRVKVPRMPGGLSFVGVEAKGISKVELELGTISVSGFARKFRKVVLGDVVVLDDFVFGKPYLASNTQVNDGW